jgi:hypothetical protein
LTAVPFAPEGSALRRPPKRIAASDTFFARFLHEGMEVETMTNPMITMKRERPSADPKLNNNKRSAWLRLIKRRYGAAITAA